MTLCLLYEDTDQLYLPRVKLATESALRKYEPVCVMRDHWYPQGWDIGPHEGPFPGPSWTPFSMSEHSVRCKNITRVYRRHSKENENTAA